MTCWTYTRTPLLQPSNSTHPSSRCAVTQLESCPSSGPLLRRLKNRRHSWDFSSPLNRRRKSNPPLFLDFVMELTWMWPRPVCLPAPRCPAMDSFWNWMERRRPVWSVPWKRPWPRAWAHPIITVVVVLPHSHQSTAGSPLHSWRTFMGLRQARLVLQTYQAMSLLELWENRPPPVPLLNEVRIATDHILRVSRALPGERDGFHGRGTKAPVVNHVWGPGEGPGISLDGPVSAGGLFCQSLDAIQVTFELKKHAEAFSSIIPRRDSKQQPANLCRAALPHPQNQLWGWSRSQRRVGLVETRQPLGLEQGTAT